MKKYIEEGCITCKYCKEESCYSYSTDEIEFNENGKGHYYIDVQCTNDKCGKQFRKYYKFKYEITEEY